MTPPALDEAGYRRLVEQVPAVVVVFALDRDLAPVYVSPQSEAILGVPVRDWFERTEEVIARIHPDDRVLVQMKLVQQARGMTGGPAEFRWRRPDGRELWLRDGEGDGARTVVFRQIVGVLARRIVTRTGVGQRLDTGQRMGLMKFGSRMDVFVPPECDLLVSTGDRVVAGETVIARWARPVRTTP